MNGSILNALSMFLDPFGMLFLFSVPFRSLYFVDFIFCAKVFAVGTHNLIDLLM